jgi:hypothetical protein
MQGQDRIKEKLTDESAELRSQLLTKKKPTETAVGVGWEDYFLVQELMQLPGQSLI